MNIGMLWHDNDKNTSLREKIEKAVIYYANKYHKAPNLCFVHPSMMPDKTEEPGKVDRITFGSVTVKPNRSVLPNHFWIGVETNA